MEVSRYFLRSMQRTLCSEELLDHSDHLRYKLDSACMCNTRTIPGPAHPGTKGRRTGSVSLICRRFCRLNSLVFVRLFTNIS